ncbi:MAG: PEP-CTERM sorting domain-containing protein [Candidatus Omnitrophica bacterium]|nr:PEP-CTERM sorting domain-containing protein [Candidatus Omnitrophota bacterium]
MKKFFLALLVIGAVVAPSTGLVFADPVPDPEPSPVTPGASGEQSVDDEIGSFIDDLDGGGVDITEDQALQSLVFTCPLGGDCPGGIIIEQAGLADENRMGIYDIADAGSDPDRVEIFVGGDTDGATESFELFDNGDGTFSVFVGGSDSTVDFDDNAFRVYIENDDNIFFQDDSRNVDGERHVLIFHTEDGGTGDLSGTVVPDHSFIFAFEDLPEGPSDFDYNDFLYHFQIPTTEPPPTGVIPEPGTMLLFGLGGIGAAFSRRRKVSKV